MIASNGGLVTTTGSSVVIGSPHHTNFFRQLSKAICAGIEDSENLSPLRPFLSSREMIIVLDNAESILDLHRTSMQEIYAAVGELTQSNNICLCITSRVSAILPHCETLEIPTSSTEAARDTFYWIYKYSEWSGPINNTLGQLDLHPLSTTLLATVAQHNKWVAHQLIREWERQQVGMFQAQHSGSLAAAIELSLASPVLRELEPNPGSSSESSPSSLKVSTRRTSTGCFQPSLTDQTCSTNSVPSP